MFCGDNTYSTYPTHIQYATPRANTTVTCVVHKDLQQSVSYQQQLPLFSKPTPDAFASVTASASLDLDAGMRVKKYEPAI